MTIDQLANMQKDIASTKSAVASGTQLTVANDNEPNSAVQRPVGLTSFVDAEDTIYDLAIADKTETEELLEAVDTEAMDLAKILGRPIFMQNVNWTSSNAANSLIAAYGLPDDLLNGSPIKFNRVQNNQYMRADVVFRIEASPIQFQAGRLWMCFESFRNNRGARAVYGASCQYTALPGVAFDPAKPAPIELRIPFSSIVSAWDLPMGQFGYGVLLVYVLSPLNSATATNSTTVGIQAWFEHPKLSVPTQQTGQSGPALRAPELPTGEPMRFQSAEQKQANNHTFSKFASAVGSVASVLSGFPLLSSVATPVAALARGVARTAAAFGFAKPLDTSAPTKIVQHNRASWVNADGPLPAVKLSNSIENAIEQKGRFFPNPVDEMEISYIVKNPVMVNQWSWSTSDAVGKIITVIPVHPGLVDAKVSSGTYTFGTYAPSPLAYVASMFKYWAGSLKYKLEAVSTPFHAGRLIVAYVPDFDPIAGLTGTSINEVGNYYSVLWDITDSSQLEFEVPFLSNTPYLDVFLDDHMCTALMNSETTGVQARDRLRKISNGSIVVYVLNQLVSPSTAASSISIMNWVGGGKDIMFAEPVLGAYKAVETGATRIDYTQKWYDGTSMSAAPFPIAPTRFEDIEEEHEEEDCPMRYESAPQIQTPQGIDPFSGTLAQKADYQNFIPMRYLEPAKHARLASGEVITNLRALTRRLTPAYVLYPQSVTSSGSWAGTAIPPTNLNVLVFDPDYFGLGDGQDDAAIYNKQFAPASTATAAPNWLTELESHLSYIGRMYVFARGSRIYGVSSNPNNQINSSAFTSLADEVANPQDKATFEFRLSVLNDEDSPPRQPYFRPEDNLLGYNYANTSSSTLSATNYTYGFNSALSGNFACLKSGESGCGLVVQVPPTSRYPFKLVTSPNTTEANYIKQTAYTAPRSRRFVELRYRPFSSTLSGATLTYVPKIWPFPTTIMEAGADDFSFGGLMPPPLITKVAKTTVFPNYSTGAKIAL